MNCLNNALRSRTRECGAPVRVSRYNGLTRRESLSIYQHSKKDFCPKMNASDEHYNVITVQLSNIVFVENLSNGSVLKKYVDTFLPSSVSPLTIGI